MRNPEQLRENEPTWLFVPLKRSKQRLKCSFSPKWVVEAMSILLVVSVQSG